MTQLIHASGLSALLREQSVKVFDCRADLTDRSKSKELFLSGHIPGAIHAHLEEDLSGPILPGKTGRHPLPEKSAFEQTLRQWGLTKGDNVVVYDQSNSMFAVRLWWMLQWAGIKNVVILNGGLEAWKNAGGELTQLETALPSPSSIEIEAPDDWIISDTELKNLTDDALLLDARALNRYSGETEPLDSKAGHIPGAINADFSKNLNPDGTFKSRVELAERFASLKNKNVICYCGSGVTACHNLFAIVESGQTMPKLYPGSWSEWITREDNTIATGVEGAL